MAVVPGSALAQGDPLQQAEGLLQQGRFGEAAALVERAGIAEGDPRAAYLYGFALINLYRFPEAEAALERAVAGRPGQANWLHALAKARIEQGKNLAALEALGRAVALDDDPRFRYARAMCALNLGDLDTAEAELEATVEGAPDHAEALFQLAKLRVDRGDYEAALPKLERALSADPRHLEARYLVGLARLQTGRPAEAAQALEAVVEEVPGHSGALYNLGRALIAAGREAEGRRRLEQFAATSELRDEIDFLRRAVQRNPGNLEGRLVLAAKLLAAGKAADALTELTAARSLDPGRAEIYLGLAEALRRLGRAEDADRAEAFARRLR